MTTSCAISVAVVTLMVYRPRKVFSTMHFLEAFDHLDRNFIGQYRTSLVKARDVTRGPAVATPIAVINYDGRNRN